VIVVRGEAPSVALRPLVPVDGTFRGPVSLFNAGLDRLDERGLSHPYLADALPQLNTDSWSLLPNGRMETRYRLKNGLAWQDGTPLSSEDFGFAWRVYATPALGQSGSPPFSFMEDVLTPDPGTVVIRWRQPYGEAGVLNEEFQALPRHILQQPFQDLDPAAFANLPFWSAEYVGLGAYKVERWEPGAFIEARAFEGFALGRPKIERVKIMFIPDPNTALAGLLSGETHYVGETIFGDNHAQTLENQWAATQGGTVLYSPTSLKISEIQLRAEHADPPALLDVRVRRALAHGIDSATANEVLTRGRAAITSSLTSPRVEFYPEIDRAIAKYPFDPVRVGQLMQEAGYVRGGDGFFVSRDGASMDFGVSSSSGAQNEQENAVIVDSLRKAGFSSSPQVYPAIQLTELEARALTPGLSTRGVSKALKNFTSEQIPRADNRWRGFNRPGWASPAYDRAFEALNASLEPAKRVENIAELERVFTQDLPAIPHWFNPKITAHVVALKGPAALQVPDVTLTIPGVHEWEWSP